MEATIFEILSFSKKLKSTNDFLCSTVESDKKKLLDLQAKKNNLESAITIIVNLKNNLQKEFCKKFETIANAALAMVFPDRDFKLVIELDIKYRSSSAKILIEENGNLYDPKKEEGGGLVDVISCALRFAFWSMNRYESRNFFAMDEPLKFLGAKSVEGAQMLKLLAEEIKIQLLITTHDSALEEIADKIWRIANVNSRSEIELDKA